MGRPAQLLHTDEHGVTRCWWCASDPIYVDYLAGQGFDVTGVDVSSAAIGLARESGTGSNERRFDGEAGVKDFRLLPSWPGHLAANGKRLTGQLTQNRWRRNEDQF